MITKYDSLPQCLSSYIIIEELGKGAFSTVYKVKYIPNGEIYCLKKISQKKNNKKFNEVKILQSISHIHLITFISSFVDDNYIYIIMEYCEYGDLYSLLLSVQKKGIYIMEDVLWDIAFQTLLGLEYIHDKQIIHRDIKLLNIFMNKDKIIKIGDLGMSKLYQKKDLMQSRVGTPLYLPPELVTKDQYDFKVDIWSLGCSLYHLSKCQPPFNEENMIKLGNAIVNDTPSELPNIYSDLYKGFLSLLMSKKKENRPTASEALSYIPERIKEKYQHKKVKSPCAKIISSFNSVVSLSQSKESLQSHRSTKHCNDMGEAGILLKKQIRNFPLKRKSGTMIYNFTKRMNGTQEGFFKIIQSDTNKIKSKTQTNFFNMNTNIMFSKGELLKKCSLNHNNVVAIQKEYDNYDKKQQGRNKEPLEEQSKFPIIGIQSNIIQREKDKEKKCKDNEAMFRKTFTLFRSKNYFTKPLTINDID